MTIRTLTLRLTLPILLTMLGSGLSGCAQKPATQLKIRDGAPVTSGSQGPEAVSTVGLSGQSADGSYTCSAAIIGRDLLVTAGHCVPAGAQLAAYFGTDMADADPAEFVPAIATLVNPTFGATSLGGLPLDDVALVRLSAPIPVGFRPAIVLPTDQDLTTGESVRLAGFGITESGDDSGILRFVDATYAGPDAAGRLRINDPQQRGACSGDSGGPLFASYNGTWYVAGVLSGGPIPCRGVNAYTSLAAHQSFLSQATATLEAP